jgi:uncharacterized damage-inducible protein DinB
MSEVARIVDQMQRAWDGDAWHGPPLYSLLADVSVETANAHPIRGVHSIAEIVWHVAFWKDIGRRRLERERVFPIDAEGWPGPRDAGDAGWQEVLSLLKVRQSELMQTVSRLSDERLAEEIPGKEKGCSAYVLLHGLIQHDLYHAGQIALLKKAAAGK